MSEGSPTISSPSDRIDRIIQLLEKIPEAQRAEVLPEIKREIYRSSLFATAKYLLGYQRMVPHAHGKLVAALESATRRKLIVMPRGTFKTSITSVAYPIWLLMRNPNLRILLDSEVYTNSKNILREIKAHIKSKPFMEVFGDWEGDTWAEGEIIIAPRTVIRKEPSIACSGIGAGKTGQHYDVIIADDMNSPKNSNTPEGCEKVVNHYRMYTSLAEPEDSTIAVIGTRYSANDLIGFILKNELGITNEQEFFR